MKPALFINCLEQAVIVHRCIQEGEFRSSEVARRASISVTVAAEWLRLFNAGVSREDF
jgi:hypothetical protein